MRATMTRPVAAYHHPIGRAVETVVATVDVDALAEELVQRTVELTRALPRGVRAPREVQCAKDLNRLGRPTLAGWLRGALIGIRKGQSSGLYGELVADVLGAAVATVLPLADASLAETLAECYADPLQERANRADATPDVLLEAARAMDAEAVAARMAARAYRQRRLEKLRRGDVA